MQPQFENFTEFLDMGGYGFFVWLSFAVSLVVMAVLVIHTILVKRKIKQTVEKEQARALRIMEAREKRKQARAEKSKTQQADSAHASDSNINEETTKL